MTVRNGKILWKHRLCIACRNTPVQRLPDYILSQENAKLTAVKVTVKQTNLYQSGVSVVP